MWTAKYTHNRQNPQQYIKTSFMQKNVILTCPVLMNVCLYVLVQYLDTCACEKV